MTAPIDKWIFKEVTEQRLIFIFNSLYRLVFSTCLWPGPPAPSLPSTCCLPSQPGRPKELRHYFFLIALLLFLIVRLPRIFSSRGDVMIYRYCQFLTFSEPRGRGKGSKVQWRRGQHRRRETFLAFQMCCRAPLIVWNQPGQVQKSVIIIFISFYNFWRRSILPLTPLPRTQMMVAMMEMAVAVRAGGAMLVIYCMMDTWVSTVDLYSSSKFPTPSLFLPLLLIIERLTQKMFIPVPSRQLVRMRM